MIKIIENSQKLTLISKKDNTDLPLLPILKK
jgi:hypothetical protein